MTLRHQGHVTFFCPAKGWGFIRPETAGDVFVHYTGIAQAHGYRKLEMNQRVEFEIEETPTGRQAKKVTMLTPLTEDPDLECGCRDCVGQRARKRTREAAATREGT